jgi:hypothetical protein
MRTNRIKYIVLFIIIILFAVYQILMSLNIAPYLLTSEDILIVLFLLISIFLLLISFSLSAVSESTPPGSKQLMIEVSPEEIDISPITGKDINFFLQLQEYFKGFLSESEVLSRLLAASVKITKSKRASILLHDRKTGVLFIFKTVGWRKDEIKMLGNNKIRPGEGITGRVFQDGKPLIVNNLEKETDFEPKDKYRSKSFVSIPLFSDMEVIGVMNLTEQESDKYSVKELEIVRFMVNEVSGRVKFPLHVR